MQKVSDEKNFTQKSSSDAGSDFVVATKWLHLKAFGSQRSLVAKPSTCMAIIVGTNITGLSDVPNVL